jgi:hypothetical protein
MSTDNQGAKVIAHLRLSNELAKRYQDAQEKAASEREAVRAKLSEAVQALVKNDRIFTHQVDAMTEKLAGDGGAVAAIELIRDLAEHRNAAELEAIGTPASHEKTASAQPTLTGGPIADYDETESGQAFRRALTGA